MELNKTYNMNCIEGLNQLNANSVDLCVTSPPYDDMRTFNDSSNLDFNVFKDVAQALTTVLKDGGVIMWNVGDATIDGSESGSSFRQALYFKDECGLRLHDTMIYEKTGIAFASGSKSVRYSQAFEYCFILSKGRPKTVNIIMDKPNNENLSDLKVLKDEIIENVAEKILNQEKSLFLKMIYYQKM